MNNRTASLLVSIATVQAKAFLRLLDPNNPIEMTAAELLVGSEEEMAAVGRMLDLRPEGLTEFFAAGLDRCLSELVGGGLLRNTWRVEPKTGRRDVAYRFAKGRCRICGVIDGLGLDDCAPFVDPDLCAACCRASGSDVSHQ